jgi:hypothetical protein
VLPGMTADTPVRTQTQDVKIAIAGAQVDGLNQGAGEELAVYVGYLPF